MKRFLAALLLLIAPALVVADAGASFDPKDLKDASIADVVTTLGALAGLPVYIDPDVSGKMTIQTEDVPFEFVLKLISGQTGIWVRIENGKLVASRSKDSLFAALTVPERFHDAPRIPVSEVRGAASSLPPFYLRTRWNGIESCARLEFPEGERPTISVPLTEDASAPVLYVTQFDVDPVSRTRFIALDGAMSGVLSIGGRQVATRERQDASGSLSVLATEKPQEPCRARSAREEPPQRDVQLAFVARETGPEGPGELVMAPSLSVRAGATLKARAGRRDDATGQQRELVLAAYVSRDATWVTAVLTATAIWIDPRDGSEYYFTQPSSVVGGEPRPIGPQSVIATIPAGVATPRAIELTLLAREAKPEGVEKAVSAAVTARP